jgi:hypothetical protein
MSAADIRPAVGAPPPRLLPLSTLDDAGLLLPLVPPLLLPFAADTLLPPPRTSLAGLAFWLVHFGMCRSAACKNSQENSTVNE